MNLRSAPFLILSAGTVFVISWFYFYFTTAPLPSVDLPTFIHSVESLKEVWWKGAISFYDRSNFTGWVPFQFYPFLPGIVTALLSYPFSLFTDESVVLSAHILLVLGSAALPALFYYVALPLLREASGIEPTDKEKSFLAVTALVFAFWFINHDQQWYGIGSAAVMHIGLFSQLFGWIFLLLFLGTLLSAIQHPNPRQFKLTVLFGLGLILSHLFTFLFAVYVSALIFLLVPRTRRFIFLSLSLAILLSSFWLLPMVLYMGEYTAFDIYRPKGDFLELFFRYPLYTLLKTFFTGSGFTSLNPLYLFTPFLILYLLGSSKVRKDSLIFLLFLTTIIGVVVFNSGFVASSFALGLHYYRFNAYLFLLLSVILVPIPTLITKRSRSSRGIFIGLILPLSLIATIMLPHYEREMIRSNNSPSYLENEERVVQYFSALPTKGRIFNEYLTDYKKFAPLSAHILSQMLTKRSGFEVVTNSHVQESVAYRMLVVSANLLGAKTYNTPLLFTDRAKLDDATNIEHLKSFGVTHIIAGRDTFANSVKQFTIEPEVQIGKYKIFKIAEPNQFSAVTKKVLGYVDLSSELPFKFMQYYFYSRKELAAYELLALTRSDLSSLNSETKFIDGLIVNFNPESSGQTETIKRLKSILPLIELNLTQVFSFDHYHVRYQHNMELDLYNGAEKYLDSQKIPAALTKINPLPTSLPDLGKTKLDWGADAQSMKLTGLTPGKLYRVNYSYFPYWSADSGQIFRGSKERIFIKPNSSEMTLSFSRYYAPSSWIGIVLSVLGVYLIRLRALDSWINKQSKLKSS